MSTWTPRTSRPGDGWWTTCSASIRESKRSWLSSTGFPPAMHSSFESYSSFLALPTLYLEDLFVLPEFRKMKAGYFLFHAVAREARRRGCGRMEWTVLDWNAPAIEFYRRLGAKHMKEWHLYRLTAAELDAFEGSDSEPAGHSRNGTA